jgi:hypothetical protein
MNVTKPIFTKSLPFPTSFFKEISYKFHENPTDVKGQTDDVVSTKGVLPS